LKLYNILSYIWTLLYIHQFHNINSPIYPSISQYQLSYISINYTISTLLYIHQFHNINSPVYPSISQYQLSYILWNWWIYRRVDIVKLMVCYMLIGLPIKLIVNYNRYITFRSDTSYSNLQRSSPHIYIQLYITCTSK
jgi:hypothetical protein